MAEATDDCLFNAVCMDHNYVFQGLTPLRSSGGYNLRSRSHDFSLPSKDDRNYIPGEEDVEKKRKRGCSFSVSSSTSAASLVDDGWRTIIMMDPDITAGSH